MSFSDPLERMPRPAQQESHTPFVRLVALLPDLPDTLALLGFVLVIAGVWMVSLSAALIVAGLLLLALGLFGATR